MHLNIVAQEVVINEFCTSDSSGYDWIEIYNYGNKAINLKDFHLSDKADSLNKWTFPDYKLWQKQFLLIYASGKNFVDSSGFIHTNFKLKYFGETIILSSPSGKIIDKTDYPKIKSNNSLGRYPNGVGTFKFYDNPSPGKRNSYTYFYEYIPVPEILHESGFYTENFYLKVYSSDEHIQIHYTLDGSEPTEYSPVIYDSLLIENRSNQKNVFSNIPTTFGVKAWYGWISPIGLVEKCTNIKIKAFKGNFSSKTVTKSFFVFPNVKTKYTIPVISLTLKTDDLVGSDGIFVHYDSTGKNWEIPAHIDFFEPDGTLGFSSDIGIRTHGANTRKYRQKSLRIYFRKKYGTEQLEYQIFPDSDVKIFKKLILRNGGSDWAQFFMRDAFAQSILIGFSNLPHQSYRAAIVFINGEFSGLMNIREYYDKTYFKQHFNSKKIDLLKEPEVRIKYGDNKDFLEMLDFVKNNDLSIDSNYEKISELVDIDNFIDYNILQIFVMNTDQPGKNVFYWRSAETNNKWQWILYDIDDSFRFGYHNNYQRNGLVYCTSLDSVYATELKQKSTTPSWANNSPESTILLRKILQNENFRIKFINRFADLLNTAFLPEYLENKLNIYYQTIKPYMNAQYKRWRKPQPSVFASNYNYILTFIKNRNQYQIEHIKQFFNIKNTINICLNTNNENFGYVKINTLPINNNLPNISDLAYPWTGKYFYEIPVKIEAVAYDGYYFEKWKNINDTNSVLNYLPTTDTTFTAMFTSKSQTSSSN